ncbi:hypothetical protein BGZ73_008521 [Actinomortierella ambigua]|nr:hypothetical protein BGZ73_008521 [Actinomortierella ambigua]
MWAVSIYAQRESPHNVSTAPIIQKVHNAKAKPVKEKQKFTLILSEAVPYLAPSDDFPPDQWGYRNGHVPLPIAPVRITLKPSANPNEDDRVRIQAAIDQVGNMPLQPFTLRDGSRVLLRGAVLLQAGTYHVQGSLILHKDGVILRGEGNTGPKATIVHATGDFIHDFIHLNGLLDPATQGSAEYQMANANTRRMHPINHYLTGDRFATPVANEYVAVGSFKVPVVDVRPFKAGADVVVERPSTAAWIHMLGMDRVAQKPNGIGEKVQWDPDTFTLSFVRKVVKVVAQDPKRQAEAEAGLPKHLMDEGKRRRLKRPRYPNGATSRSTFDMPDLDPEPGLDEGEPSLPGVQQGQEKRPQHQPPEDSAGQREGGDGAINNGSRKSEIKGHGKHRDSDGDEDDDWDDWGWGDWFSADEDGDNASDDDESSLRKRSFYATKETILQRRAGETSKDEELPEKLDIDLPKLEDSQPISEVSSPPPVTTLPATHSQQPHQPGALEEEPHHSPKHGKPEHTKTAPAPASTPKPTGADFSVIRHHVNSTGDYILEPEDPPSGSKGDESRMPPSSGQEDETDSGAIPGHLILDVPLVMSLDPQYGGGYVYNYERQRRIPSDIGLENMQLVSSPVTTTFWGTEPASTAQDSENHAWFGTVVNHCDNCWVADVAMQRFVSGVKAGTGAVRTTIQDCEVTEPISKPKEGGRRYMYMLQGQMGLVKRCRAQNGRHDFITGAKTSGPNVFVDSEGLDANNDAGPHDRWSVGTLYDNIKSFRINIQNRGHMGSGQGWAGAFHVMYHCDAEDPAYFQSPPGATNWIVAFNGSFWQTSTAMTFEGADATYLEPSLKDLFPINRIPRSLYWSQLVQRMGGDHDEKVAMRMEELVGAKGRNQYPPT